MTTLLKRLSLCAALVLTALAALGGAAAQEAEPQAWDGQRFSDQPADVQSMFQSVWGSKAAQEWATERSTALLKAFSAAHSVPVTATSVIADAPPIPQDTTMVPLTWTTAHAPITGDLIDIDQERHKLYVGHSATDPIEQFDVST